MTDIQELLPITGHETQENRPVGANEAPSVKRLDGEVTRIGVRALTGGMHCEVWEGRWEKRVGGKVEVEKVNQSITTSILLISLRRWP